MADKRKRILAVASGGGHWEQILLLRDAFTGHDITFATTMNGLGERAGIAGVRVIHDCNRNSPMSAVLCTLDLLRVIARVRPQVIVSTGALPGFLTLAIGRRFGIRTVWVDSIANAEELSMAGQKARPHADLWLSQWPFVAERTGAGYAGSVL
ncbi:UDP-N-acetylglucosamine--LPS N-acetylglucosamine transferase [Sphingomonas sp. PB1R3]|uniref:UDP-N-acetylglucosamine--LPS N-acetylglucosamine transferase n=1 Tax=Sphingomonas flavida TaxID=3096154 RepID=UPI002FC8CDDD